MTRSPLRRLRLRSGEEHREVVPTPWEPFDLGGQRYLPVPAEVGAELMIARATSGDVFRLRFDVRLHGPCMRCLADAVEDVHVNASEYQASDPAAGGELRSEYVVDGQLVLPTRAGAPAVGSERARRRPAPPPVPRGASPSGELLVLLLSSRIESHGDAASAG